MSCEKEISSIAPTKYFDLNIETKNILMLRKPESPELLCYSELEDPYRGIAINLKDSMITYFTEVDTEDSSFKGKDYGLSGYQTRLNVNGKMVYGTAGAGPDIFGLPYTTGTVTKISNAPITPGDTVGREFYTCLLYTSPSPRDRQKSRMPSSA